MNERSLFWQLPLLLLLTSPLWHGTASQFLTIEQQSSKKGPIHQDSNFMMEDIAFLQAKQGVSDLLLHAKRLHGASEKEGFDLVDADAKRLGPRPAHITGGNAHYDPEKEILTILDDVIVQTADLVVKTSVMRYLARFETIKSAADVEMTGQGFNLTGNTFMYNLTSGNLRVGKRVSFLYTPPVKQITTTD